MNVLQAVREDVGEADDDRSREIAGLEALYDLMEIDDIVPLRVGTDDDVAGIVDREVALSPRIDVVEVERVLDPPRLPRGCTYGCR